MEIAGRMEEWGMRKKGGSLLSKMIILMEQYDAGDVLEFY